ncbi:MAG: PilZ domain-containing protein [Proteobacteria bacterium]|nr:PilZ domain-containing protein [Pseudomonadota bacterium]MBU1688859.1 PilZ domain-containing protein [Pseudomonadota bacterium]
MPTKTSTTTVKQLVHNELHLSSNSDYKKLIKQSPDNPYLYKLYADFLIKNKSLIEATKNYRIAFTLFLEKGLSLQAIAALMKSWEIVQPAPFDLRTLHSQLKRKNSHISAIAECFAKMAYSELTSVLTKISQIRLGPDHLINRPGDDDDTLYFIITGEVIQSKTDPKKLSSLDESTLEQEMKVLNINDHFGDLYPCDEKKRIKVFTATKTVVELFKISRTDLLTLCGENPDLDTGLKNLLKDQTLPDAIKPVSFSRKSSRQNLSIMLHIEIYGREPGLTPIVVKGFSSDISLGGVCVVIDPRYRDLPLDDIIDRSTKVRISLPDETVALTIMGRLAWHKRTEIDDEPTSALGIQFNDMPPRLRGLLIVFANTVGTMSRHMLGFSQDMIESQISV